LFIDPAKAQITAAKKLGADLIEINTGQFSEAKTSKTLASEFKKLEQAVKFAKSKGFFVSAGHGLDYDNIKKVIEIKEIEEFNIGHSIISRSIFVGIVPAIEEMLDIINSRNVKKKK